MRLDENRVNSQSHGWAPAKNSLPDAHRRASLHCHTAGHIRAEGRLAQDRPSATRWGLWHKLQGEHLGGRGGHKTPSSIIAALGVYPTAPLTPCRQPFLKVPHEGC